jgi:hypothetical protein
MADPNIIVGVPVYPDSGIRAPGTGEALDQVVLGRMVKDLADAAAYNKQTAESAGDAVKPKLFAAKAAATGNVALTGAQVLDTISCGVGDRVFLFQQSTASQNGPWIVGTPWTRPSDFNSNSKVVYGQEINVVGGANYAGKTYELVTAGPYILGSTALVWAERGGSGGTSAGTIQPVDIVLTSNDSLSGLAARDGVTPTAGYRALATAQTTASQNGVYVCASGAWTRAADCDADGDLRLGQQIKVKTGTPGGGTIWELSAGTTIAGSKTYSRLLNAVDAGKHDTVIAGVIQVGIPTLTASLSGAALTAAQLANATLLNNAFTTAAAKGNCFVELCALPYDVGVNYLTVPPAQGLRVGGRGSSSFTPAGPYTQGSRIVFSGGGDASWDVQVTGTVSASVAIGTGQKTFTGFPAANNVRPGDPIRFTATAGATGSVTGIVYAYNPLGTSITVDVTSVTGSGTGTAWSYTTRYDKPPLTARSHAGFVLQNLTIETTSASFRGYHFDANGTSLASDSSKLWVHNVMFYQSGTNPTAYSDIHCVGGIYMTSGFTAVIDHCKFHNMFRGAFLRGNDNYYCFSNESIHVQDAAVDLGGEGVFGYVHAEPAFPAANATFAGGGVRVTNSWEPEAAYYSGDACDQGPEIAIYGSFSPKIKGNFSIKNTAVGVDKYPVLLDGTHGTIYAATDQHCQGAIRADGLQACYGIDVQTTSQTLTSVFTGSNYAFTRVMCNADTSGYGIQGRQQISNAYLTNGAEASLGMHFIGANGGGPLIANSLNIVGLRSVDYSRGSSASELGILNTNRDVFLSLSATNDASGFGIRGKDFDGASTAWLTHFFVNANGFQHRGAQTVLATRDISGTGTATAKTIDWNRGHVQSAGTLAGNITFTMTPPAGPTPTELVLEITQGASNYTVAFSPAVKTEGGAALTIPSANGAKFEVRMRWNGTEYRARVTGAWS